MKASVALNILELRIYLELHALTKMKLSSTPAMQMRNGLKPQPNSEGERPKLNIQSIPSSYISLFSQVYMLRIWGLNCKC